MKNKTALIWIVCAIWFISILSLTISVSSAVSGIPTINSYITDDSGVLSEQTKQNLEIRLRQLEKNTSGVQYTIFIEDSYPANYTLE